MRRLALVLSAVVATSLTVTLTTAAPAGARGVAPPGNDDIADASALRVHHNRPGRTVGATREATDPGNLRGPHTVWYTFGAASSRPVALYTEVALGMTAHLVVYRRQAGVLRTVFVGRRSRGDGEGTKRDFAAFEPDPGTTYYVGVTGGADGSPFRVGAFATLLPTRVTFPGAARDDEGRPQLHVRRGRHPRVTVVVRSGYPGSSRPTHGRVTLQDGDHRLRATLRDGRATFVLPRIRRDHEITVRYPGSERSNFTVERADLRVVGRTPAGP